MFQSGRFDPPTRRLGYDWLCMEKSQMADRELDILETNLRLGRAEYFLQRTYLRSMPRMLGLVLGNACNIDCPHCYQEKNGDNLLRPADIGHQLRREFLSLYPYLATLQVQGGEALAYRGFRELVEDVASVSHRPLLSVTTNGTGRWTRNFRGCADRFWSARRRISRGGGTG
jgi:sulfatase maturation enzyme AslB (radical SAM superfamily)